MKGILKIYHPEETLKYHLKNTYCKAVFLNNENFLEVEIISDDDVEHVEDDSLQYQFPQIALNISDFPIETDDLLDQTFLVDDESSCEVNLFDDEDAYISENSLKFENDEKGDLFLFWKGNITDFYTGSDELIPFKLKCHFKAEEIEIDD
ncbi:hypothetical protein [Halpernia frigidisoli]|uniref:Uncharacterized protein n=1 Tax=Halpernia frigidisoli TaxID=1125876 RepID=A0A1I3GXN5_9FLAO|nr:hypothetical protein [Halpernia frigidisoli]SFI28062.1 hypothetical protein SAMN05443292_2072 [Halpernia frigidisoli]